MSDKPNNAIAALNICNVHVCPGVFEFLQIILLLSDPGAINCIKSEIIFETEANKRVLT